MTVRELVGVLGLHALLLAIGVAVVWAVRGLATAAEAVRLGGVAWLTGLAVYGTCSVLLLVVGVPYRLPTMVLLAVALLVAAIALGRARGRAVPRFGGTVGPGGRALTLGAVVPAALLGILLAAVFRQARLEGLFAWDAWWFWVPKAQAILEFGGLDAGFFSSLPGPSYPPLVPAVEATALRLTGSTDPIALNLVMWGFAVAFAWSVIGLLAGRVRPFVLWGTLLLLFSAPELVQRMVLPQADVLLDWLVGLAALLVCLWLRDAARWQLTLAAVLLAAATVTKREGLLLAAIVVVAALVATARRRQSAWPPLLVAAGGIALAGIPWRIWFMVKGYQGDGPEAGGIGLVDNLDRVGPSLELTLRALFGLSLWPLVVPLAMVGMGVAWSAGRRAIATYASLVLVLSIVGFTWVLWSFPTVPLTLDQATNPIIRLAGGCVVMLAALTPLLLAERSPATATDRPGPLGARRLLPTGIVVVAVAGYVGVIAADGVELPSRDACVRVADPATTEKVRIVYGRDESLRAMLELRDRVVGIGFVGTEVRPDGCGRWIVAYDGVDTYDQAAATAAEATAAGLEPRIELDE